MSHSVMYCADREDPHPQCELCKKALATTVVFFLPLHNDCNTSNLPSNWEPRPDEEEYYSDPTQLWKERDLDFSRIGPMRACMDDISDMRLVCSKCKDQI